VPGRLFDGGAITAWPKSKFLIFDFSPHTTTGVGDKNPGKIPENSGQMYENLGKIYENVCKMPENVGKQPGNTGKKAPNIV